MRARKVHQKIWEDDDEANHYDIQKKNYMAYNFIFKGIKILPYFLVVAFIVNWST